jgi:hypothetical protein
MSPLILQKNLWSSNGLRLSYIIVYYNSFMMVMKLMRRWRIINDNLCCSTSVKRSPIANWNASMTALKSSISEIQSWLT